MHSLVELKAYCSALAAVLQNFASMIIFGAVFYGPVL